MNEETIMLCLQELKTDMKWVKRLLAGMASLLIALITLMIQA